jgi:hypothetical protein
MRITCGGNVGIGTTSPSQKLEVVGGEIKAGRVDSTNEGGQLSFGRASDNATGYYIDVYGNTSTPDLRFVDTSNSAVRMILTGAGNIQIDNGQLNTPKSLYFQTNSSIGGNLGSIDWYNVQWDGFTRAQIKAETDTGLSNGRLVFSTGGGGVAERMRITSGGQVQIGCGVNASFYNGPGCRYNFTALNTAQDLVGVCANNGIIVIRDHTVGGTGAFLIDPNQGVICMASNIPATVSIAWNGSLWRWCLTSGSVPRCLGYGFYGA